MKNTTISGTRWRLVVYQYQQDFPTNDNDISTTRAIVSTGIESISVTRAKGDPNGGCTITFIGDIDSSIFIGNWCVVRKRTGAWTKDDKYAAGLPVFVGQITNVNTQYFKDGNGTFIRRSNVTLRSWSSAFQAPIRYDLFAAANSYSTDNTAQISLANKEINGDAYTNLATIAAQAFNPWTYVGLGLKFLGALNSKTEKNLLGSLSGSLKAIESFPEVATRMPAVPKELLEDVGAPNTDPNNPFASGEGLASVLLGVVSQPLDADVRMEQRTGIAGAFSGLFPSQSAIDMYDVTTDRPVKTNVLMEFTRGESFWSIVTTKSEPEYHETFVDTWYYDMGDGQIGARPVFVFRDRPYSIRKYYEQLNNVSEFTARWTKYDDLPRVFIDNTAVRDITLRSTFFNSPNYIIPNIVPGAVSSGSPAAQMGPVYGRVRLGPEMVRFGAIELQVPMQFAIVDNVSMPQIAQTESSAFGAASGSSGSCSVNVNWYRDCAQVSYLWHGFNYRFLSGSLVMEDDNTPLMIGNNITWKMGENTLCAQVEGLNYQHSVDMGTGKKSTTIQVSFSYCCLVNADGSLALLGPSAMNDIFDKQVDDQFSVNATGGGISSWLEQLKKFQAVRQAVQSAMDTFRKVSGRLMG